MKKLFLSVLLILVALTLIGQTTNFTDTRDSKVYTKVTIGTQIWMAENLNYETDDSWCYTNDTSECTTYGRLYPYEDAITVCPTGWHLPTDAEWRTMEQYVGMGTAASSSSGYRSSGDVGYYLKSTTSWSYGGNGLDSYLFTVLPAGFRKSGGNYMSLGSNSLFWTATESGSMAYGRMFYYQKGVERSLYTKQYGASVRCVKD